MRGVTRRSAKARHCEEISTHTPHARRDRIAHRRNGTREIFLLTRLMRGVTALRSVKGSESKISTHTPHARRDGIKHYYGYTIADFYSHASCEA